MEIKEFTESIKKKLEERTGKEVMVQKVTKNNGLVLHGIHIVEPEKNMIPTLYLEPMLKEYNCGSSMEDIVNMILETVETKYVPSNIDISWITDFKYVKSKVVYRLVNYQANQKLLQRVPHEKFLDLVKVYYVMVQTDNNEIGSILINDKHMEMWNITEEQLKDVAEENTAKLFQFNISEMRDVLVNMGESVQDVDLDTPEIYVATNTRKLFGANIMCYVDKLKEFAEQKNSDLIILPSSVHEILILTHVVQDVEELREMVCEVNRTQLEADEMLSDNVYIYSREKNEVLIA